MQSSKGCSRTAVLCAAKKIQIYYQVVISIWQCLKMNYKKEEMENYVCAEKKWN
jgi:hypothetical protein